MQFVGTPCKPQMADANCKLQFAVSPEEFSAKGL